MNDWAAALSQPKFDVLLGGAGGRLKTLLQCLMKSAVRVL